MHFGPCHFLIILLKTSKEETVLISLGREFQILTEKCLNDLEALEVEIRLTQSLLVLFDLRVY